MSERPGRRRCSRSTNPHAHDTQPHAHLKRSTKSSTTTPSLASAAAVPTSRAALRSAFSGPDSASRRLRHATQCKAVCRSALASIGKREPHTLCVLCSWPVWWPAHFGGTVARSLHTKQLHSAARASGLRSANAPPRMSSVSTSSSWPTLSSAATRPLVVTRPSAGTDREHEQSQADQDSCTWRGQQRAGAATQQCECVGVRKAAVCATTPAAGSRTCVNVA